MSLLDMPPPAGGASVRLVENVGIRHDDPRPPRQSAEKNAATRAAYHLIHKDRLNKLKRERRIAAKAAA